LNQESDEESNAMMYIKKLGEKQAMADARRDKNLVSVKVKKV
jgi:hypothetical protein